MADSALNPLDVFIRQQIYIEGYKDNQEDKSSFILEEIVAIVMLLLLKSGYDNLGDMPRRELNKLIINLNRQLSVKFNKFEQISLSQLRQFFNVNFSMNKYIFKRLGGKTYTGPAAARLWASLINLPAPGIGEEPRAIFRNFARSMYSNIVKTIKQGYAENASVSNVLKRITGTKDASYKDGLINKFKRQLGTNIRTFIQNISSFLLYSIGSALYETYQWVSVLDSRTTDICRSRDGNIYRYGEGPRPPAHYNCRSTIIPVELLANVTNVPTYHEWAAAQPMSVLREVFGTRTASNLKSGRMSADDLGGFVSNKALTLEEFKGKRNLMLTPNDKSA